MEHETKDEDGEIDLGYYEFFSDPTWQSVGAILSGVTVFIGAWYGTRLANNSKVKDQKAEFELTKKASVELLDEEMLRNKELVEKMVGYLILSPPIVNAFDALIAGASHLKIGAWNNIVNNNVYPHLTTAQHVSYYMAHYKVKTLKSNLDMEVAEWKRIYEFHKYYKDKEKPPEEIMQLGDLKVIATTKAATLREMLKDTLFTLSMVEKNIRNDWKED